MSTIETTELAPGYNVPRIINGGWQLQGQSRDDVLKLALGQADAGLVAFETADTYPDGENLMGELQALRRRNGQDPVRIHTRYSPDVTSGAPSSLAVVKALDDALIRLRCEQLDLVQLQWWRLDVPGWLDVYGWLSEQQQAGKIAQLGLSNFTTSALETILAVGLPVVSNQVQISLVDQRALGPMRDLCLTHDISLLAYGPLCGGNLATLKPDPASTEPPVEYSSEYRLMVEQFGGWDLLQNLVTVLIQIADRHDVSASVIALRWVLDQAGVSALMLGASNPRNIANNLKVFNIVLTTEDQADLDTVLAKRNPPNGGPGELEREPDGLFQKLIAASRAAQGT
jgi:aryl-alcohol dehydrogenase-like predicted oxidoreductase